MSEPKLIDGTVYEHGSLELRIDGAKASEAKRTRWLVWLNESDKPTVAPGVRTHQLSLLLGMGREWYKRAMAETTDTGAPIGTEVSPVCVGG